MLEAFAVEGRRFKARELNEITFGDLAPRLKGNKLEYTKVKSIFGVRGEYGEKASSMKLLRMVQEGYVERRKDGMAFSYRLTRDGWKFAEQPVVRRIPIGRIPLRRPRKPRRIVLERIDPIQETNNLISDRIEILKLKETRSSVRALIRDGKYRQAADHLISWYLMAKFDELVEKKERQFQRREERFKKRTGKDLNTLVDESRPRPQSPHGND